MCLSVCVWSIVCLSVCVIYFVLYTVSHWGQDHSLHSHCVHRSLVCVSTLLSKGLCVHRSLVCVWYTRLHASAWHVCGIHACMPCHGLRFAKASIIIALACIIPSFGLRLLHHAQACIIPSPLRLHQPVHRYASARRDFIRLPPRKAFFVFYRVVACVWCTVCM